MSRRAERVAHLIREEISDVLRREIDDPRLKTGVLISVTDVEMSPDLRHARVFVSVLGNEQEVADVLAALNGAEGFVRRALGPRLDLRYLPEIRFYADDSLQRGARIDSILQAIRQEKEAEA